jgi:hypothetical protein
LAKDRNEMVKKKKECGTRNQFSWFDEDARSIQRGYCEGGMVFLHYSSVEKMVHNTKGGPTLALA